MRKSLRKSPAQIAFETWSKETVRLLTEEGLVVEAVKWENLGINQKAWEEVADELEDYYRDRYEPRGWY